VKFIEHKEILLTMFLMLLVWVMEKVGTISTSYIRAENTFGELPILMGTTEFCGLESMPYLRMGKTHFGKCSLKFPPLQQPFSLWMAELCCS